MNNFDLIEKYLNNELSDQDRVAFEHRLASDEAFAKEVALHKDVLLGIDLAGEAGFLKEVASVQSELEAKGFFENNREAFHSGPVSTAKNSQIKSLNSTKWLAVAASLALLAMAIWWIFLPQPDTTQLIATAFEPYEDVVSEIIELELSETGFADAEKKWLQDLKTSMDAYNSNDYNKAIQSLEELITVPTNNEKTEFARFYLAVSLLEERQFLAAASQLEILAGDESFSLYYPARWYLALAYLQSEQFEKARTYLESLQNDPQFGNKAKALLRNIQ